MTPQLMMSGKNTDDSLENFFYKRLVEYSWILHCLKDPNVVLKISH